MRDYNSDDGWQTQSKKLIGLLEHYRETSSDLDGSSTSRRRVASSRRCRIIWSDE